MIAPRYENAGAGLKLLPVYRSGKPVPQDFLITNDPQP
jgi:hypothetical protein